MAAGSPFGKPSPELSSFVRHNGTTVRREDEEKSPSAAAGGPFEPLHFAAVIAQCGPCSSRLRRHVLDMDKSSLTLILLCRTSGQERRRILRKSWWQEKRNFPACSRKCARTYSSRLRRLGGSGRCRRLSMNSATVYAESKPGVLTCAGTVSIPTS